MSRKYQHKRLRLLSLKRLNKVAQESSTLQSDVELIRNIRKSFNNDTCEDANRYYSEISDDEGPVWDPIYHKGHEDDLYSISPPPWAVYGYILDLDEIYCKIAGTSTATTEESKHAEVIERIKAAMSYIQEGSSPSCDSLMRTGSGFISRESLWAFNLEDVDHYKYKTIWYPNPAVPKPRCVPNLS